MKFLVVDDSAVMRGVVLDALRSIGYEEWVEAEDGIQALRVFDGSIDFVLADERMPNMGGVELVRSLRGRESGRDVPILMIATKGVGDDIVLAAQAGANNYILKPVIAPELREKIDQVLIEKEAADARCMTGARRVG